MQTRTIGPLLLSLGLAVLPAEARVPQEKTAMQNSPTGYSNTSEGLQNLISDILKAAKAKDSQKETELIRGLLMPENSTWFTDEYGPGFGASLAAAYRRAAPQLEEEIKTVYEANALRGWMEPKILIYADPEKVNAPIDHFLNSMNQIVSLYQTAFQGDRPGFTLKLSQTGGPLVAVAGDLDGYFVYDQIGFRFIPSNILMKLPSERPIRVHLGMNVMQSKLLNRVYPKIPQDALARRLGGKVVIRVELDRDGNIQEAKVIEGDPILSQAAMDAVKQWRFEPTRLDGDLVEVEVDVEMGFEIH
jgi:TonB family protein